MITRQSRFYPRVNGLKTIPFQRHIPYSQYMGVPARGEISIPDSVTGTFGTNHRYQQIENYF